MEISIRSFLNHINNVVIECNKVCFKSFEAIVNKVLGILSTDIPLPLSERRWTHQKSSSPKVGIMTEVPAVPSVVRVKKAPSAVTRMHDLRKGVAFTRDEVKQLIRDFIVEKPDAPLKEELETLLATEVLYPLEDLKAAVNEAFATIESNILMARVKAQAMLMTYAKIEPKLKEFNESVKEFNEKVKNRKLLIDDEAQNNEVRTVSARQLEEINAVFDLVIKILESIKQETAGIENVHYLIETIILHFDNLIDDEMEYNEPSLIAAKNLKWAQKLISGLLDGSIPREEVMEKLDARIALAGIARLIYQQKCTRLAIPKRLLVKALED
jgi:hypothetical protein